MVESEFHITHYPVFYREIVETLKSIYPTEGIYRFVDGTGGEGGHVEAVLQAFPNSEILFLDRDPNMIERAYQRLGKRDSLHSLAINYSKLNQDHLAELGWEDGVDGILLDLGISIYHITDSGRGFSFRGEEILDMRLDGGSSLTAASIVNGYSSKDLEKIFYEYGEERWTKKIVERILERRKKDPIETNKDLAKIIESAIPRKFWPPKAHPSTRVFQALRIEVNQELVHLEKAMLSLPKLLRENGIFQVISFHSLEDRIVKHRFRDLIQSDTGYCYIQKKAVLPTQEEISENPPSRSAKLRSIQRSNQTKTGRKYGLGS